MTAVSQGSTPFEDRACVAITLLYAASILARLVLCGIDASLLLLLYTGLAWCVFLPAIAGGIAMLALSFKRWPVSIARGLAGGVLVIDGTILFVEFRSHGAVSQFAKPFGLAILFASMFLVLMLSVTLQWLHMRRAETRSEF